MQKCKCVNCFSLQPSAGHLFGIYAAPLEAGRLWDPHAIRELQYFDNPKDSSPFAANPSGGDADARSCRVICVAEV